MDITSGSLYKSLVRDSSEAGVSISDWFKTFNDNLRVSKQEDISRRYKAITKRLNTDFWDTTSDTSHSLYVGSYGRNTASDSISDIDIIFCFPYEQYKKYDRYSGNGQSALLQLVRNSIKKTYSVPNVGADGQVILVPFDDGITFEVVPAFINKDDSFTFPDANGGGSWKTANPKPEIEAIRTRNAACNGNLVSLCRMMRPWKVRCSVSMGGLLIDTLAYQFIDSWSHKDKSYLYYDFMVRDFFKFLKDQDENQNIWRAPGSGQYVFKKGNFKYKATSAYNLSLEAIKYGGDKMPFSAKKKWREIFGTAFPS